MTADPIDPEIVEITHGGIHLLGGRCQACSEIGFPRQETCRRCGENRIAAIRLADRGVLWSWTIQRFRPPSPPYLPRGEEFEPFGLGYVELPGEVIVEALLTESDPTKLCIGMPMQLTGIEVPTESGSAAMTFAFAPAGEGGN